MSGVIGLVLALFLPLIMGVAWIRWLWPSGGVSVLLGYGYLTGVLMVASSLWVWGNLGLPYSFWPLVVLMFLWSLVPLGLRRWTSPVRVPKTASGPPVAWQRWLWWLLLGLLAIRFGGLLLEEMLLPLYPWDAWMNWAPRGKVWFELGKMVPFVAPAEWGRLGGELDAYTLGNPQAVDYPPLVPLVLMWNALGLGEWRDNWINLSWGLCGLAFALGVYGQLRTMAHSAVMAMLITSLLFTMPYLNTHVALAGYADIWVSAFFTLAVLALIHWSRTGGHAQLVLVILMALGLVMTKRPGLIWALILLAGVLMGSLPERWRSWALLSLVMAAGAFLITGGVELKWQDAPFLVLAPDRILLPGMGEFNLSYHPAAEHFIRNDLVRDNWHLMGWLILLLLPVALWRGIRDATLLPAALVVMLGMVFLVVVFFFTSHYRSAVDSTTINRATFHLLPALALFCFIALLGNQSRKGQVTSSETPR